MQPKTELYPLLFQPVLKDYVWGGRSFEGLFGRDLPDGIIAESWEIAGHRDGTTIVANGELAGKTLTDLHAGYGLSLIGSNSQWAQDRSRFPLLIKLLDAQNRLSVQVHPDDAYAQLHENDELGKSEMWVVLHARPEAEIILGVTRNADSTSFKAAIEANKLDGFLHRLKVSAGDYICVPSGSLHAILGGIVLAEIQQNSNVTYRVYDWGRKDSHRPLHIDKALDVINFDQVEPRIHLADPISNDQGILREGLCQNEYFKVERLRMERGSTFEGNLDGKSFEIWGTVNGTARIHCQDSEIKLAAIRFSLLPASIGRFSVLATESSTLLRIFVD